MKCCHCSHNAFTTIEGIALCLSCHTDFQNTSNNNVSSAYQLSRGANVANSMLKARASLIEREKNNERNTVVNNNNTHNNITVNGNNSGSLQARGVIIHNNNIGVANLSKSSNCNADWLAKIISKGLRLVKCCLRLIGLFR